MFIEILNKTFRQMNILVFLPCKSLTIFNFSLFVVHDSTQNKSKSIFAFVTLISTDVHVLIVSQMRKQACDKNSEELVAFLNRISFQIERAKFFKKAKTFNLEILKR